MLRGPLLAAILLAGCAAPQRGASQPPETSESCGSRAARAGGEVLERPDGTRLWYRVRGADDRPAVVYLHGGPGYNGYGFEQAVGDRIAGELRLVVLDQRGCGRSTLAGDAEVGMQATIADLDALREALKIEAWTVLGHSFGGLVAQAYAAASPDSVAGLILVETSTDLPGALSHQVATAGAQAAEQWPEHAQEVEAVARSGGDALERLLRIYATVGLGELQSILHWHDPGAQQRADAWDADADLLRCTHPSAARAFVDEGWLRDATKVPRPAAESVLIGGRRSSVIGAANLRSSAAALGAPLVWMDDCGHFPFVEAPDEFTRLVVEWTKRFSGERPPTVPADPGRPDN